VILFVLLVGISAAKLEGLLQLETFHVAFATPVFTIPQFSMTTLLSIGIPLFIVTMTSQNIPGIAVLNASGFKPPVSNLMTWTGVSNILFAPFGCYSICLTALTAAICAGEEADENPSSRYKSTLFAGLCWFAIGIFGATLVNLFFLFPKDLVIALAGLALLGTLGSSLKTALEEEPHREPALITILVSASGISFFGVGSACWGLLAGILSTVLLSRYKKEPVAETAA
jgi:benzoate membrane transport protein